VIHFAKNEILWQCSLESKCECGKYLGLLSKDSWRILPKASLDRLYLNSEYWWYSEVQNKYSRLEFTVVSDKLAALSGVATLLSKQIGSEYLAGLWSCHLPRSLMWRMGFPGSRKLWRSNVPTWSWLSMNENSSLLIPSPMETRLSLTIIEAMCRTEGKNPFGQVDEWFVDIKGPSTAPDKMEFLTLNDGSDFCYPYINCGGVHFPLSKDEIDYDDDRQNLVQMHQTYLNTDGKLALTLLLIGNTPPYRMSDFLGKTYFALVLKDSTTNSGCFERFGIAEAKFKWNEDRFGTADAAFDLGVEVTERNSVASNALSSKAKCSDSRVGENEMKLEPS
jgi:hypothetical protein